MSNTRTNPAVPIAARKIWDTEDSRRADGGLPEGVDLRGEIHPDLIRYKGYWYCGFKERLRARWIRSADAKRWQSVRVFSWDSGLLGDPKLSVTAEGALMITTFVKGLILLQQLAAERLQPGFGLERGRRSGVQPASQGGDPGGRRESTQGE